MQDHSNGGVLVTTTVEQVGRPVAGAVIKDAHSTRVSVTFGHQALWSSDPSWLRELSTAAAAAAHALEAEQRPCDPTPEPEPVVEVIPEPPAIEPEPAQESGPCESCGHPTVPGPDGPVHPLEDGGWVAAGRICRRILTPDRGPDGTQIMPAIAEEVAR
jgi:hypothetical protein